MVKIVVKSCLEEFKASLYIFWISFRSNFHFFLFCWRNLRKRWRNDRRITKYCAQSFGGLITMRAVHVTRAGFSKNARSLCMHVFTGTYMPYGVLRRFFGVTGQQLFSSGWPWWDWSRGLPSDTFSNKKKKKTNFNPLIKVGTRIFTARNFHTKNIIATEQRKALVCAFLRCEKNREAEDKRFLSTCTRYLTSVSALTQKFAAEREKIRYDIMSGLQLYKIIIYIDVLGIARGSHVTCFSIARGVPFTVTSNHSSFSLPLVAFLQIVFCLLLLFRNTATRGIGRGLISGKDAVVTWGGNKFMLNFDPENSSPQGCVTKI